MGIDTRGMSPVYSEAFGLLGFVDRSPTFGEVTVSVPGRERPIDLQVFRWRSPHDGAVSAALICGDADRDELRGNILLVVSAASAGCGLIAG